MLSLGHLSLRAYWHPDHHTLTVDALSLQRPPVSRLWLGQAPDTVLAQIPRLFSLCPKAQTAAAHAALVAAGYCPAAPAPEAAALWREWLHETFWRLLLDWPQVLQCPPALAAFVEWRKAQTPGDLLTATETVCANTLPALRAQVEKSFATHDDAAHWSEIFWRRTAPLENALSALRQQTPYPLRATATPDGGSSSVLTARGELQHTLVLAHETVQDYQIFAPTDRHFASPSALMAALHTLRPATLSAAEQAVHLAVLALDPCVPFQIEVLAHA